jgi:valyl-tRNA synthetase
LVTGPDIIFFWVARMIMAGLEYRKDVPFKNVYFTGIVRDKQRRKMSKSLGNSPDPIELIEKYGADGVRVGILLSSAAGNDLLFDEDLMLQGRNFATKIWNAYKLIQGWKRDETIKAKESDNQTINWFGEQLNKTIIDIEDQFSKFRISDGLHLVYKLIWDDFCSWYLEAVKPNFGEAISEEVYQETIAYFEELMKLLHPFAPFLSEELWQSISERQIDEALIIAQQKKADSYNEDVIKGFDFAKEVISGIRNYRQSKGISPREAVEVFTNITDINNADVVKKLANISGIHYNQKTDKPSFTFLVGANEFSIPLSENLDLGEEKAKTEEEIKYLKGFLISVDKKLSNEKFVANAKPEVVENERKKQKDAQDKIALLEEKLKTL